jgi:hypothetical protein
MYCRTEPVSANKKSALFVGTKNIQIYLLISHDRISEHLTYAHKYLIQKSSEAVKTIVNQSKIDYKNKVLPKKNTYPVYKALTKLTDEEKNKMTYLFKTAYAVAKSGKPYIDYLCCVEVHQMNGFIMV